MSVADVLEAVQDHIDRAGDYDLYRDYEEGRHKYPYASQGFRDNFSWILKQARANACESVRSNFTDLVQIQSWSGAGAKKAAELAETSDLDMVFDLAVNESWRCGDAYILAWPGEDAALRPWYHRADQVAFKRDPSNPDRFLWVAKLWIDGDDYGRVNVYYDDRVERYESAYKIRVARNGAPSWRTDAGGYVPATDDDGPEVLYSSIGVPGMPWEHIPFDAQTQGGHGRSILRDVVPMQDGLNHAVHAIIVNTEQYAAPLRALLNYVAAKELDPLTGRQRQVEFDVDPTRKSIYAFEGENGNLIQLDPPDAKNILEVKRDWHTDIANTVGLPVSDIVPDLGNIPSGAALRVLAARRTAKVRSYTKSIRGRVAHVMELLGIPDAYPEFQDPAPTDETEQWEIAESRDRLGFPLGENLREMGWDQEDIDRVLEAVSGEEAAVGRAARVAYEQGQSTTSLSDAGDVKSRADAMGVLIRAGVDPEDAAEKVGLDVDFTGAVPTSLRLPEAEAGRLEAT